MGLSGTRGAAAKQKGANKGEGVDGNAVLRLFGRWPILDLAFLRRGWFGLELPDCRAETWLGAGDGTGLACLLYRVWCVPAGTGTRRGEKKKLGAAPYLPQTVLGAWRLQRCAFVGCSGNGWSRVPKCSRFRNGQDRGQRKR